MGQRLNKITEFFKRDLLHKNEGRLSYFQVAGFILISIGVIYFASFLLPSGIIDYVPALELDDAPTAYGISIAFFNTMLGVAFAFPGMLKGQTKEISTMRIVVFMFSNVICLLLLKLGWGKESLTDIGLNEYWLGVIAFLFGAKATQSYFESRSKLNSNSEPDKKTVIPSKSPDSVTLIKLAIQQNNHLKKSNPAIETMTFGSMVIDGHNVHCVDLHLSQSTTGTLPPYLTVQVENKDFLIVPVNVIQNIGVAKTNTRGGDTIINQTTNGLPGTLGCFLQHPTNKRIYALTCCHVLTSDQWINYNGFNVPTGQIVQDTTTGITLGIWIFGLMNNQLDFAYTSVNNTSQVTPSGFSTNRNVNDQDILHKTPVEFNGAVTPNASAMICNYDCTRTIYYGNTPIEITNLILISTSNNTSPSFPGDSGALVYTQNSKEPIGIIVAADLVFSYVIPINSILSATGLTIY